MEHSRRMTDNQDNFESALARHDVEIQAIDSKLDHLSNSVSAGFERIYSQLRDQSKFPIATVLTGLFGLVGIISLLAGGYIGKPMGEIKDKQDWILEKLWETQYTLGRREIMIDSNHDGLVDLDVTLQREMRLLDDISNERLKGLDATLQREMRLLGDVLEEKINAINAKLEVSTKSRFTANEGKFLKEQIDEISKEQRSRTNKIYDNPY